jgi:predicted ArsR family transcriptional regulator
MPLESRARARDQVLFELKTRGAQTAGEIADRLGITAVAVRQHLALLAQEGLVEYGDERGPVGRPARVWWLTPKASDHFPDAHSDLAVELFEAMREVFGESGVKDLLRARSRRRLDLYLRRMPGTDAPLKQRVGALTAIRRKAGSLAEWAQEAAGGFLLIENHCPIAAASQVCPDLCAEELKLWRSVLGRDASVKMVEHILAGDRRCVFRIRERSSQG